MSDREREEIKVVEPSWERPDQGQSTADLARRMNDRPDTHEEQVASHPAGMNMESQPGPAPLLPRNDTETFRSRWTDIQTGFVDEPRQAVERADTLVAEVIKRLAENFAEERGRLEDQWSRGQDVSTEELRVALRRYRSFFDRLLSL